MSSQYQGDVMDDLFDEAPEVAHFDEEGFEEEGFDEDGFDEEGFEEESFDEDGFEEEAYEADGFDEDAPDHGDLLEMAVADALDSDDVDEFFGKIFNKIKKAVPGIKSVLGTVGKIAGAIPLPMTQAIGGVANTISGLLADEADEGEAFDGMVDLVEEEDAIDAAAPVIAGMALRKAAPAVKHLPKAAKVHAVKQVTKTVKQLANRHGTAAVVAAPAIVHTAKKHLAAQRLPAAHLPAVIRKVAAHAHRNPQVLSRLVRQGRAMLGAAGTGHAHRHHHGYRWGRRGYRGYAPGAGGYSPGSYGPTGYRTGGYGPTGYSTGSYGPSGHGGMPGRARRRYRTGGVYRAGGGYSTGGAPASYGSVGTGSAPRCAHCGRPQRLRFHGPIQLIIKPL